MRHKLILGAAALLLPVASFISVGAGSATAHANLTGTGTFSCKTLTGALTFKPPLTLTPRTEIVSSKTVASNCSGTAKPLPKTATATSSASVPNYSCANLKGTKPAAFKTTITYSPVVATSTETGLLSGHSTTPLTFSTTGKVTGSYPSTTATSKGVIKETVAVITADCTKAGLPQLTIISGSTTNG